MSTITHQIGIDEAGRGPLAGPVAVGVVLVPCGFDWELLPGVTDSKQLSEAKREGIYTSAKTLEKSGQITTAVTLVGAKQIDKKGIVPAITKGITTGLQKVMHSPFVSDSGEVVTQANIRVLLDGGLVAPVKWPYQETIVKGDSKEKVIGLASILAKVTRDRYMRRAASLPAYSAYNFAQHKGYGTKAHREAIVTHGLSSEHRVSFCKNTK